MIEDEFPADAHLPSDVRGLGAEVARRLALLVARVPLDRGVAALLEAFVTELPQALGDERIAVGVAHLDEHGVRRVHARPEPAPASGLARQVFPAMAHERVVALASTGLTFHAASDSESVLAAFGDWFSVVTEVLAALVERARAHGDTLSELEEEVARMRRSLAQSERLAGLGRVIASVVHELNNPVAAILVGSEVLERRLGELGASVDDMRRARRLVEAAERVQELSRDVLFLAREPRGAAGPVDLVDVVRRALGYCEHVIPASVVVTFQAPETLPLARGSGPQLAQLFVNLITNAAQALAPGGGSVEVVLRAEGNRVEAWVDDDGPGVPEEVRGRVFDAFFTTRAEEGGTGLGLAIVSDIVAAHEGTIRVERSDRGGARFRVALPTWSAR